MGDDIPHEARLASRAILIGPQRAVLYLRAHDPKSEEAFWVMPGGGLEAGESFQEAAVRELLEETGSDFAMGPYVWFRRHRHQWNGKLADQYERFVSPQKNMEDGFSGVGQ